MDAAKLVKQFRRKLLCDPASPSLVSVEYNREDIQKIIPHRDPFLFLDAITGIDLEHEVIVGKKKIHPEDPVFRGHFPEMPVYPGLLQSETIGQLALCFYPFFKFKTTELRESPGLNVRVTRLHHALFQDEVKPGDILTLIAKLIDYDDFMYRGIGQAVVGKKICTIVVGEFYLLD